MLLLYFSSQIRFLKCVGISSMKCAAWFISDTISMVSESSFSLAISITAAIICSCIFISHLSWANPSIKRECLRHPLMSNVRPHGRQRAAVAPYPIHAAHKGAVVAVCRGIELANVPAVAAHVRFKPGALVGVVWLAAFAVAYRRRVGWSNASSETFLNRRVSRRGA